ncbi:MAG: response regulator [Lachnospiraceae bacterium]|nr:response regulator [Lachnospiraceae bacterium]
MLSSVAKYVGRQLIERVNQRSFSLEEFRILREQLLTYEQFYRTYERQSPQFSLLFNTGRGYFAYCMTSSEMPRRKDSLSAIAKNAVSEIEERLRPENTVKTTGHLHFGDTVETIDHLHPGDTIETIDHLYPVDTVKATEHLHLSDIVDNEVSQKKKILVVDDSDFMRKSMLDLLGRDYEVLTASSGTSAIRRMTLARPDLVLLDYEMPVCNGIQVLEMIRSEKDFTDIPIIFLTCRVDRESVKKVISFKPDGYLSKSLPAKSLKNEIDHFFEKKDFYN